MRTVFVLILVFGLGFSCSSSEEPEPIKPKVNIESVSQVEGDEGTTTIDFKVKLSESVDQDVILTYATEDASAFQELDYNKTSGQLTIPAGNTEAIIPIEIITDLIKEGNEEFKLLFNSDMEVEFSAMTAIITIGNDDAKLPYDAEDYSTPANYEGWTNVWSDEFNGTEINTDWWTHEIGRGDNGWGNNELEYYTDAPENSRVEDGKLIIEARNDSWNGHEYTSARMITRDKKSFTFSRTDIRAKVPFGQGIWPALWMLGDDIGEVSWPACGEIDIMELVGHQASTSHATVHWGKDGSNHKYTGKPYSLSSEIFNDRFHVFSVVRDFNQMYFYVDDVLFYEFSSKDLQGQPNPFNNGFFFIFNVAIGGNWPGNPDETTQFPQTMEVDYIRVFEKN